MRENIQLTIFLLINTNFNFVICTLKSSWFFICFVLDALTSKCTEKSNSSIKRPSDCSFSVFHSNTILKMFTTQTFWLHTFYLKWTSFNEDTFFCSLNTNFRKQVFYKLKNIKTFFFDLHLKIFEEIAYCPFEAKFSS